MLEKASVTTVTNITATNSPQQPKQQLSQGLQVNSSSQANNASKYRWLLRSLLLWALALAFLFLLVPLWTGLWIHESLGLLALVLAIVHLKLNFWFFAKIKNWFKQLFARNPHNNVESSDVKSSAARDNSAAHNKDQLTEPQRGFTIKAISFLSSFGLKCNEILSFLVVIGLICSLALTLLTGIVTSQELFAFIPWEKLGSDFNNIGWRNLHMMFAYYFILFASFHAGLHVHALFDLLPSKLSLFIKCALLIIAVNGALVWVAGNYRDCLLGQQLYSFWDYSQSIVWILTDKFALVVFLATGIYLIHALFLSFAVLENDLEKESKEKAEKKSSKGGEAGQGSQLS